MRIAKFETGQAVGISSANFENWQDTRKAFGYTNVPRRLSNWSLADCVSRSIRGSSQRVEDALNSDAICRQKELVNDH